MRPAAGALPSPLRPAEVFGEERGEKMIDWFLAKRIAEEGKPFQTAFCDEGNEESGPRSVPVWGYKWGQLRLEQSVDGYVVLFRKNWTMPDYGESSKGYL